MHAGIVQIIRLKMVTVCWDGTQTSNPPGCSEEVKHDPRISV